MVSAPIEGPRQRLHLLTSRGITHAFHYAPLHYLLFIARSGVLYSKTRLLGQGYHVTHFRRTSAHHDVARGFGDYVHLSLKQMPPILQAKLEAGFPHFEIEIPTESIEQQDFHLCRFNIAKCRYLRRGNTTGPDENPKNGRYYSKMQLPIAVTENERASLVAANFPKTMVEVLIANQISLPKTAAFVFFSQYEFDLASALLRRVAPHWPTALSPARGYRAKPDYLAQVETFLEGSSRDPLWKGNGLEFDSV